MPSSSGDFLGRKGSVKPRAGFGPATTALPRRCPTRLGYRGAKVTSAYFSLLLQIKVSYSQYLSGGN
jgi:hypothetical protein